jgi:hypothetical protein
VKVSLPAFQLDAHAYVWCVRSLYSKLKCCVSASFSFALSKVTSSTSRTRKRVSSSDPLRISSTASSSSTSKARPSSSRRASRKNRSSKRKKTRRTRSHPPQSPPSKEDSSDSESRVSTGTDTSKPEFETHAGSCSTEDGENGRTSGVDHSDVGKDEGEEQAHQSRIWLKNGPAAKVGR